MRRFLVVLILCSSVLASDQSDKEYQTAVDKAKAEFDAKVKVAKDKYVSSLKVEMTDLTKKGDLDGAVKIRDKIAGLDGKKDKEPEVKPEVVFLKDLVETASHVGYGDFGKGKLGWADKKILVSGVESPNGLALHGETRGAAYVKYSLEKKYKTFKCDVAISDDVERSHFALTYKVTGDGIVLWTSKPILESKKAQPCQVDVSQVDVLELRVDCSSENVNAHSVWVEPRLEH